ncbi:DUF1302 domain-containing protein [Motiliproteus sp. SC1-56]|uniref:DUF1302 domain-containing protein n=1 Tax=Motiliproteus sp. SC1-56 TaxID=2799565 RepID=UPI001A8F5C9C|nr:DUF1302 domain-containing protein [Motiliproteus sp. SC1-56]
MAIITNRAAGPCSGSVLRKLKKPALPVAGMVVTLSCGPVQALEFNLGEVEGRLDSQLSIGASWRMEDRDPDLISAFNDGNLLSNGVNDDGNLNFDDGDAFTKVFKGVHDLELTYRNLGFFGRGKYWYDFELKDGDRPWGHVANGYDRGASLDDDTFNDYAKFSGAEILDAFVYGDFEVAEKPLSVRLGRQVVNWGESTFVRGGISSLNPVDVAAFRRPGAEIKEGLLPSNMLFGNLGITDSLSVEAFYQLQFEKTVLDGCGTYFSTLDYVPEGCDRLTLGAVAAQTAAQLAAVDPTNPQIPALLAATSDAGALGSGFFVDRAEDGIREADDEGQYGLAFRYFAEELNFTEFGFYFLNYHSRTPVASGISTGFNQLAGDFDFNGVPESSPAPFVPNNLLGQNPVYFTEYPEDVQALGLSFSTNVGVVAVSGEVSHHRDVPFQINGADLVGAILTAGTQTGNPVNGRVQAANAQTLASGDANGTVVRGYDRFDVTQAQVTAIHFIDRVLGASRLALVGEVAFNHVHSFDEADEAGAIRYGRASEFGQAGSDGFVTANSWGYRARAVFNYNDVFAGINLKPSIGWSHDVDGYSPASTGFNEGSKALSLALDASYLNTYTAGISYTRFSGGDFNPIRDRDFLSASLGVSF